MVSLFGRGFDSLQLHKEPYHKGGALTLKHKNMKSKMLCNVFTLLVATALMSSCEKMTLSESAESGESNVVLRVTQFEQTSFTDTRAAKPSDVCSRLNFLVYDQDGTRIRQENQQAGDDAFGEARFMLSKGHYFVVALAHSSQGNPTSTNSKKIAFTNSTGYTDTFLFADSLIVGDKDIDSTLVLKRIVSMVRFVFNDAIPAQADSIRFYYEGGSGTFNAADGWGVVQSKQTQWYALSHTEKKFEIYTIPRTTSSTLDVTVTTNSGNKGDANIVSSREIKGIPIERNKITTCYGSLFSPVYGVNFKITIDDDWEKDSIIYNF